MPRRNRDQILEDWEMHRAAISLNCLSSAIHEGDKVKADTQLGILCEHIERRMGESHA